MSTDGQPVGPLCPTVSVIIPTRNRLSYLRRTLQTVLGQTGVDLEVIVVDEGSHDGTAEMLGSIADRRVRVVRHETPKGLPAARNAGIALATAPYTAFCDDDDMWAPDKLAAQLAAFEADPATDWCGCGTVWVNSQLDLVRAYQPPKSGDIADLVLQYNALPASASAVVVRSKRLRQLGDFDTALRWGEDWEMWIRFALAGPVVTVDRPLVAILQHSQNMSSHSPRYQHDVAVIARRYDAERRARGVRLNRSNLLRAQAEIELLSGHRWKGLWQFVKQVGYGDGLGAVKRAAAAAVAPNTMLRRWDLKRRDAIPLAWRQEVPVWLEALRG